MNKKAISPLIATILIIGFTVALAAVIMTWGQKFVKDIQEQTEETSTQQITCATNVGFEIKNVCYVSGNNYKITVANNKGMDIKEFKARFYVGPDIVYTADAFTSGLTAFDIASVTVDGGAADLIKKVELLPIILVDGKSVTCSSSLESFGDADATDVIADCA